jgi:CO/xanthine dehydrogenase FAD-binding subunit
MPQAELILVGRTLRGRLAEMEMKVAAAVEPPADYRASGDYLRAMSGVLARRALTQAEQGAATTQPG